MIADLDASGFRVASSGYPLKRAFSKGSGLIVNRCHPSSAEQANCIHTGKLWIIAVVTSVSHTWGTTAQERELIYPCDRFIPQPEAALYRGVTINAPAEIVFRWLCQMRAAPYSYDWIDNGGRQSPRELTPGLDNLAVGQVVMRIFNLVDFERDRQLTLRLKTGSSATKTFGDIAVSYVVMDRATNSCRLLVKLIAKYPPGTRGSFMRAFLPWGDLIMMRRQLLNLKWLAEQTKRYRPSTVTARS